MRRRLSRALRRARRGRITQPTHLRSLWSAEGDRFATAILAAEILLLSQKSLSRLSCGECFFDPEVVAGQDASRYAPVFDYLKREHPNFWQVFERSWRAKLLAECSRVEELRASVAGDGVPRPSVQQTQRLQLDGRADVSASVRTPGVAGWRSLDLPSVAPGPAQPPASPPQTPSTAPVTSSMPPAPEADRSSGAPTQTTSPAPRRDEPKHGAAVVSWLLAAAVLGLLVYVIVLTDSLSRLRRESGVAAYESVRHQNDLASESERLQKELVSVRLSLQSKEAALSTSQGELEAIRRELGAAQVDASIARMNQHEAELRLAESSSTVHAQVAVQSNCDKVVTIALHYQPTTGSGWVTEGWWTVSPRGSLRLAARLRASAPFYYVNASTPTSTFSWKGSAVENLPVSRGRFFSSSEHPLPVGVEGYERQAFYRLPTEAVSTIDFNCQ